MSDIIFPIRRVDGNVVTGGGGALPNNPTFDSVIISGPVLDTNGIEYNWPVADGTSGQILTTDGNNPATLTWTTPATGTDANRREDADTNTSLEVDLAGTGADNTIRYTTAGTEVHTITNPSTSIKNSTTISEKVSTTLTTVNGPLNYTANFGPIHTYKDSRLYYVAGTDLVIVDVSFPESVAPVVMSSTNFGFIDPTSIKIRGYYAYVSEGDTLSNLSTSYIIDISDPVTPTLAGTFNQNSVRDSQIQGRNLYTADVSEIPTDSITLSYDWAKNNTGTADVDDTFLSAKNGFAYTTGFFSSGTVIFDALPTLTAPSTSRTFVTKIDVDDTYIWAVSNTGDHDAVPRAIFTDDNEDTYISIEAASGPGTTVILSPLPTIVIPGAGLWIIAKINSAGTWTGAFTHTIDANVLDLTVDSAGNIYIVGYHTVPITLGALPTLTITGGSEMFLAKMDNTGTFLWSINTAVATDRRGRRVRLNSNNNPVVLSDASSGLPTSSNSIFVAEYNGLTGANIFETPATSTGFVSADTAGITIDDADNIYISATWLTDLTAGALPVLGGFANSIVVGKLDSAGTWLWTSGATVGSGTNNARRGLTRTSNGAITACGQLSGTVTFGAVVLASTGPADDDGFIITLDQSGTFSSGLVGGGTGVGFGTVDSCTEIAIDDFNNNDDIYVGFAIQNVTSFFGSITVVGTAVDYSVVSRLSYDTRNLRIVDVSNPTSPTDVSYTAIAGNPQVDSILPRNVYLYMTTSTSGAQNLLSFNIRDSTSPSLVDTLSLNTIVDDYIYTNLKIHGNYLYAQSVNKSGVAHPHGIVSVDINDVNNLAVADTYTLSSSINGTAFHNNSMVIDGYYLYFVEPVDAVLTILDIKDPTAMVVLTSIPLTSPLGLNVIGRYFYITETPQSTLTIYNYQSCFYQQFGSGTLYTNNTQVGGNLVGHFGLESLRGITVDKGVSAQRKSSINGNLTVNGNIIQRSGIESRTFRQLTGAGPTTTLENDYVLNTNHTGTAIVNLLPVRDEAGAEYEIVKENANQVDITPASGDLIWDGSADVTVLSLTGPVNERLSLFCNGIKWFKTN